MCMNAENGKARHTGARTGLFVWACVHVKQEQEMQNNKSVSISRLKNHRTTQQALHNLFLIHVSQDH